MELMEGFLGSVICQRLTEIVISKMESAGELAQGSNAQIIRRRQRMGIYDEKKDLTLSDVFKRAFSPEPIEISGDIEIPSECLEQLARETEVSDDIKRKF